MRNCKVGDTVFYVDGIDEYGFKVKDMTVDEVREGELTVVHKLPTGLFITFHMDDVFENRDDAIAYVKMDDGVFIQRETGDEGVAITIHPFNIKDITFLALRSRYNPELEFFITHRCRIEDYNLLEEMKNPENIKILLDKRVITRV